MLRDESHYPVKIDYDRLEAKKAKFMGWNADLGVRTDEIKTYLGDIAECYRVATEIQARRRNKKAAMPIWEAVGIDTLRTLKSRVKAELEKAGKGPSLKKFLSWTGGMIHALEKACRDSDDIRLLTKDEMAELTQLEVGDASWMEDSEEEDEDNPATEDEEETNAEQKDKKGTYKHTHTQTKSHTTSTYTKNLYAIAEEHSDRLKYNSYAHAGSEEDKDEDPEEPEGATKAKGKTPNPKTSRRKTSRRGGKTKNGQ